MSGIYIIAEAGVNHNGDMQRAYALIDAAIAAGADAVKFQTFVPDLLVSKNATKADYQQRNQPNQDSQLQMLKKLALSFSDQLKLQAYCNQNQIDFLSSPFDALSATFLIEEMQLPQIKLGSGELTNGPLLWQLALSRKPLILSTGMANITEIKEALGLICHAIVDPNDVPQTEDFSACFDAALLKNRVSLLHCTTEYPCPIDSVNLAAMDTLKDNFQLTCGYSDHTQGINISLAAAARGACIIEKHFTLDRSLPGPDHAASIEPDELKALVKGVREIHQAIGSGEKQAANIEAGNIKMARKSIVAIQDITAGDVFNEQNIDCKRPGTGISPMQYWRLLNTCSDENYAADDLIEEKP